MPDISQMKLALTSGSFVHEGVIPARHTCDGQDVSPALHWSQPPEGTKSFALVCDDPDAPLGTWVHWVIFNMPSTTRTLLEGVPKDRELPDGSRQGKNDFGRIGYGGPCPPKGPAHRYYFKLYALDSRLTALAGATVKDVEQSMLGRVLAQGTLMGRYGR